MRAGTAGLTAIAAFLVACGGSRSIEEPTPATSLAFSLAIRVGTAGPAGSGQSPPLAVCLTAHDGAGVPAPIVGGALPVRDSAGVVLAEAAIPNSHDGHASVGLTWPQDSTLGRSLDLRISVLDTSGTVHVLERTLTL